MSTPIFTPEDVRIYAETRLFGGNVQPEDVHTIRLHNGVLPSMLEHMIRSISGPDYALVQQENGREPLFFSKGILFIPQWSGFGRRERYTEMIKAYQSAIDRPLAFEDHDLDGDERKSNMAYDNYAYDFLKDLVANKTLDEVTMIMIGPLDAVRSLQLPTSTRKNEYLESQIVEVGKKPVLNLGYVFSDQSGILLDKLMREYEALARKNQKKLPIQVFMFGRFGGLSPDLERNDLVFPSGILNDRDLIGGSHLVYPMHNMLSPGTPLDHLNLNVSSVIHETLEQLEKAQYHGCKSIDMETREIVEAINRANARYHRHLDVSFGCVGYISDCPLKVVDGVRDTVARELASSEGKQKAANTIVEHIRSV